MEQRITLLIKQCFRLSSQYRIAKQRARIEKQDGFYKNNKPKNRVYYKCNICKRLTKSDQIEIDHIKPIGSFTGDFNCFINRVFCSDKNLQVACKPCHKKKTKVERGRNK